MLLPTDVSIKLDGARCLCGMVGRRQKWLKKTILPPQSKQDSTSCSFDCGLEYYNA